MRHETGLVCCGHGQDLVGRIGVFPILGRCNDLRGFLYHEFLDGVRGPRLPIVEFTPTSETLLPGENPAILDHEH